MKTRNIVTFIKVFYKSFDYYFRSKKEESDENDGELIINVIEEGNSMLDNLRILNLR